jgi:hypothetical protein
MTAAAAKVATIQKNKNIFVIFPLIALSLPIESRTKRGMIPGLS